MDYSLLRKQMIENQLISRGIKDQRLLNVFSKIERHKFVPQEAIEHAYQDYPVPIGEGQTISQPYIVALMTESLQIERTDHILEIGTGSGYQTAILASLADKIWTIERSAVLSERAKRLLNQLGFNNIYFKIGDGSLGWQQYAPFNRIIVTAYAPQIPPPLIDQLAEGGKLIIPIGNSFSQTLVLLEKENKNTKIKEICPCVFVPLVGQYGIQK
ncbi:MAG: protein-L-isoaspartate(D-aspartate) O-methyltransferase [Candidatus Omnitrophica bacterium]|nr:protein-L-isoaspartate(D-aspartate) O-methyltransferase [Candidatus Omnitrophota bacterium]